MRLAILSDIHANLEALQATLRSIETDRADGIVCLGDIVGYNANPLECVNEMRNCAALCVAGNHDRAVCGQISMDGFPRAAARVLEWTRSRLDNEALRFLSALPLTRCVGSYLVAVHGALHPHVGQELVRLDTEERRRASLDALRHHPSAAPLCAFGHTHRLGIYEYRGGAVHGHEADEVMLQGGSVYLINPGSVGQSRTSEQRATYLLLDTNRQTISVRRIDYDARAAIAKTRAAGLLPRSHFLAISARKVVKWSTQATGLADAQRH